MGTFDVVLPRNQAIVFPPMCVGCEKPNPEDRIKLSFLGIKTAPVMTMAVDKMLYDNVDPKYYGSNTSNTLDGIPACKSCASNLKWYHRILKFGYYTAWIPGILPIVLFHWPTIISVPFLVICACMPGILTLMFPPSFGASFVDDKAGFEFRSRRVAEEFYRINDDATSKKMDEKSPATAPDQPGGASA